MGCLNHSLLQQTENTKKILKMQTETEKSTDSVYLHIYSLVGSGIFLIADSSQSLNAKE